MNICSKFQIALFISVTLRDQTFQEQILNTSYNKFIVIKVIKTTLGLSICNKKTREKYWVVKIIPRLLIYKYKKNCLKEMKLKMKINLKTA